MSLMNAVRSVYGNYANFGGRARRSEYWYFVLFVILVEIGLMVPGGMLTRLDGSSTWSLLFSGILAIFGLASFVPALAVAVRRMHDTNHSGWWLLLYCLPVIGSIILLIWKCTPGTTGPNKYGPDPKVAAPANVASVF